MDKPESSLPRVIKPERKTGFGSIFFRTALLLFGVIAFGFGMSRFFNWAAFERPDTQDLFLKIRDGRVEVRRMAAVEWLRLIQDKHSATPEVLGDLNPGTESSRVFASELLRKDEGQLPDPVLKSTFAALLGYGDPAIARPALRDFLKDLEPEALPAARIMALVSLARLGPPEPADLALVLVASSHPDPSIRKTAAFVMGQMLGLEGAGVRLRELLSDPVDEVRWNAAIALGALYGPESGKILGELLEKAEHSGPDLRPDELHLYQEALRAARRTGRSELEARGRKIADGHPNLKLRQSAKEIFTRQ